MAQFFDAIQYNNGEVIDRLDTCVSGQIITNNCGDLITSTGSRSVRFPVGNPDQVLVVDANSSVCLSWKFPNQIASGVTFTRLCDKREPPSTTGGMRPIDIWNPRELNHFTDSEGGIEGNPSSGGIDLQGCQLLIPPGSYAISVFCPVYRVGGHQSRFVHLIENTNQTSKITVNSSPTTGGSPDEHFYLFTRALTFTVYYVVGASTPEPPMEIYGTEFAHIQVNVGASASSVDVASATATAINDYSGNIYVDTSENIYFTATSSGSVIIVNHIEVGEIEAPFNGTNPPGGAGPAWTYTRDPIGTTATVDVLTVGTSSSSNTGAAQASTVTSNIFYDLVANSSGVYEIQHNITDSNSIEDFGAPVGRSDLEVYTNMILYKIA